MSFRAWIDKLMGRTSVEEQPASPDPYNPPLAELTPDEQDVRAEKQRKVLDKQDKEDEKDSGGDGLGDDRYVTP